MELGCPDPGQCCSEDPVSPQLGDAGSGQAWESLWGLWLGEQEVPISSSWKLVGKRPWQSNTACPRMAARFQCSPSGNLSSARPMTPQTRGHPWAPSQRGLSRSPVPSQGPCAQHRPALSAEFPNEAPLCPLVEGEGGWLR